MSLLDISLFEIGTEEVDLVRYGPDKDAGYIVPNLPYNKCITIGVGNNIKCEMDMANKIANDISFFFFDHTVDSLPGTISKSVFHKIGLGKSSYTKPLNEIIDMCSISDSDITLLKIDCEGGEWSGDIENTDLSKISSLVIELHNLENSRRHRFYHKVLNHINKNFVLVNVHGNNYGGKFLHNGMYMPNVLELTYISNDKLKNCVGRYRNLNKLTNPDLPPIDIQRIPKIIHTCWMSDDPLPKLQQKCLNSWKKHLPEYEIKIWNSKNWDVNKFRFTAEAFKYEQWAFVADVVRMDVVYEYGGVWLDFDAEVLKPLDEFLHYKFFTGTERFSYNHFPLTAYIFGASEKNPIIKDLLDYYNDKPFVVKRKFQRITNTEIIQNILKTKYGFSNTDIYHEFMEGCVKYPSDVIGYLSDKSFIVHYFDSYWYHHQPTNVVEYNILHK